MVKANFEKSMKSSDPLITAIIPTYRRPKLLKRALRSVLDQTYPYFQVRVYDNASGDETAEVVRRFSEKDPRVEYFCHERNIGLAPNFQYAREQVDTPYFSFLSDDDILLPHCYETAMKGFAKFPEAAFSGGVSLVMGKWGQVLMTMPSFIKRDAYFKVPNGIFKILGKGLVGHIVWTSIVFRQEATRSIGSLSHENDDPYDIDFILQLAAKFPFFLSKQVCAIFVFQKIPKQLDSSSRYRGWIRILHYFSQNTTIPDPLGAKAKKMFLRQMQKHTIRLWLVSLRQSKFDDAFSFLEIMRDQLQSNGKEKLLNKITNLLKGSPLFLKGFHVFYDIANIPERSRYQALQEQFEDYALKLKIDYK